MSSSFVIAATLQALMISAYDGDTIHVSIAGARETVRIENIDTPEMPPRAKCESEAGRARAAKAAMLQLAPPGSAVVLHVGKRPRDKYGRLLARLELPSGVDAGEVLIGKGYARRWRGKREPWCGVH